MSAINARCLDGLANTDTEDRWLGLANGDHWDGVLNAMINTFDRATTGNMPITERVIEPSLNGRVILITAAPGFDTNQLQQSFKQLPYRSSSSYVAFILEHRRQMRHLPNWRDRDLVHWIFRQESPEGEMEIELLYLCSLNLMIDALAVQLYLSEKSGEKTMPLRQIYPVKLMTTIELGELMRTVYQEEATLER